MTELSGKSRSGSTAVFPDVPGVSSQDLASDDADRKITALKKHGFTEGLARALLENCAAFPIRFWIIDNSYSMAERDGHRVVETSGVSSSNVHYAACTRWEEIQECVVYHAEVSALLKAPTRFRLLNDPGKRVGPQQFSVADFGRGDHTRSDFDAAESIMKKARPNGLTPLTAHINVIREEIKAMAPDLVQKGQKAAIVLATDGLPTGSEGQIHAKEEFVRALRSLEGLPVWIVIRLCTDEDKIIEFYDSLDQQLELSLDLLDDHCGEAKEVFEFNPWLNYALPLHRIRELGFHDRVFDLIDERALTKSEIRQFCLLLFGESQFDGVPDPSIDWVGFLNDIERMVREEKPVWDPLKKLPLPWIDTKRLNKQYGDKAGCALGCVIM